MKGTVLWKRLLNEGIIQNSGDPRLSAELLNAVIVAPIIVDSRPMHEPIRWDSCSHLPIPFSKFWVEGPGLGNDRWGAHVLTRDLVDKKKKADCHCVMSSDEHGPARLGHFEFVLHSDGNPIGSPTIRIGRAATNFHGEDRVKMLVNGIGGMVMDTLMILGCKNVGLRENEFEAKDAQRAAKRHGGVPGGYRYHTLVVRPPGAKSDADAQDIGLMPRHVCRGHFAEYGPQFNKGLLFGKYAGRYYIPPHLKGDVKNGITEKDYQIPPGRQ
jgi:hypothetical protein